MKPSSKQIPPAMRTNEFSSGASTWSEEFSRRKFLEISAAMTAMLGMGGCLKQPREEILPYVHQPEDQTPELSKWYATVFNFNGYARGILAKSFQGRPLKIEGNPLHPESLGSSDSLMQASVLDLYDPERLKSVKITGSPATFSKWARSLWPLLEKKLLSQGAGLAVLLQDTTSPTTIRLVQEVMQRFPEMRIATFNTYPEFAPNKDNFDFKEADVIFGINPDFLTEHPSSLRYSRDFAQRRRGWRKDTAMNRFYALESTPSLTGSMADQAQIISPEDLIRVARTILQRLRHEKVSTNLSLPLSAFAESVANDLQTSGKRGLALCGSTSTAEEYDIVEQINRSLHNQGTTRTMAPSLLLSELLEDRQSIEEIGKAFDNQKIDTALLLDCNPTQTSSGKTWEKRLRECKHTSALSVFPSELAHIVQWQLPALHYLEKWDDLRSFTGEVSIVQPLINPIIKGKTSNEILQFILDGVFDSDYRIVRKTWRGLFPDSPRDKWRNALSNGFVKMELPVTDNHLNSLSFTKTSAKKVKSDYTLVVRPSLFTKHSASPNNVWLQELPQPLTSQCWGNSLWMNPLDAKRLKLQDGSLVELDLGDKKIIGPVRVLPGMPERVLHTYAGYGRKQVGKSGSGVGFSIFPKVSSPNLPVYNLKPLGKQIRLVETQHHHEMMGHDFVRVRRKGSPKIEKPEPAKAESLYGNSPDKLLDGNHAWAMSIDLSTCFGCKACVIACQAENNIPAVGPEQVLHGREMHWIRVDSYIKPDRSQTRHLHQPVPCMHCEKAPCEAVCPVEATLHTQSGINAMIYNRCVGTRYCSNNCPYKVRRFNFLDYRDEADSSKKLQYNPQVTVRERGVMEKCTYCIQRINGTRILARREKRKIKANEIKTACQQACPAEAITFGDLNHPQSQVRQLHEEKESYALLEELDVRPRTRYLPKWLNPGKELDNG